MKVTSIILICFLMSLILIGCSSSQNTTGNHNMQVINATFKHWSHPPSAGSDIPERGTDLSLTLNAWPEDYTLDYLVFDNRKSITTEITQDTDTTWVVSARIIRSSDMLNETSEKMDVTNRLVYNEPDGDTGFIEIEEWQRAE